MTVQEEAKKFAEENGLDEAEVLRAVQKVAICREIERIAFRADTALCSEMSLICDDMALCETPEERGDIADNKLAAARAAQRALAMIMRVTVEGILKKGFPVRIPEYFAELREVEKTDDDEKIAEYLLNHGSGASPDIKNVLCEYLEEEFDGGGDEH